VRAQIRAERGGGKKKKKGRGGGVSVFFLVIIELEKGRERKERDLYHRKDRPEKKGGEREERKAHTLLLLTGPKREKK